MDTASLDVGNFVYGFPFREAAPKSAPSLSLHILLDLDL